MLDHVPVLRKAQLQSLLAGRPTMAAASSCEQEATTSTSSSLVCCATSARMGPRIVPEETTGGRICGSRLSTPNNRFDQVCWNGLNNCVAPAVEASTLA